MEQYLFFSMFIVFISSILQGVSGFGGGLLAVPILAQYLSLPATVLILSLQNFFRGVLIIWHSPHHLDLKKFWPLFASGIVFTPLGIAVLVFMDVNHLKILVGSLVVLASMALALKLKVNISEGKTSYAVAGALGGVLNGSAGVSGPPIVIFMANQEIAKDRFRININCYFMVVAVVNMIILSQHDVVTIELTKLAVLLIPATLVGTVIGSRISHRFNEKWFSRLVVMLVVVSGVMLIASAV